jgi:folate-dependent tRNA-U54 methylase TrmFO/GidA
MLSIKEQEDFIHLIFDCVHIGVSLESLEWSLKSMKEKYSNELINIINSPMKNEKYSNYFIYPLEKVIKESSSHLLNDDFFKIKLNAIKILINYGCDLNIINNIKIDLKDLILGRIIDGEIYDFIMNNIGKISITI